MPLKSAREWIDHFDQENAHGEGAFNLYEEDVQAIREEILLHAAEVAKNCNHANPHFEIESIVAKLKEGKG